jgi:hypothetical protein
MHLFAAAPFCPHFYSHYLTFVTVRGVQHASGRLWQPGYTVKSRLYASSSSNTTGPSGGSGGQSATAENEVVEERQGSAVIITLNRPKSLNALNLSMVRALTPKYKAWHAQPTQDVVVVMKGAGGKAFCAGGDIRAMYDLGKAWHAAASGAKSDQSSPTPGAKSDHSPPTPDETKDISAHATEFFREEYILNHLIATLPQPHVALLNGITSIYPSS